MSKIYNITITNSPFESNLQIAGDLVIKLHVPYSKDQVTVKINPNITAYDDKPGSSMRQISASLDTNETVTLSFDFNTKKMHKVKFGSKNYEIQLMNIGTKKEGEQNFPIFEFQVIES